MRCLLEKRVGMTCARRRTVAGTTIHVIPLDLENAVRLYHDQRSGSITLERSILPPSTTRAVMPPNPRTAL